MKIQVMYKISDGKQQALQVISLEIQGEKLKTMNVFKEDRSGTKIKMTSMPVEAIQCIICV